MPNIMDEFPSKYLKASDVEDEHPTVTIAKISREEVGRTKDWKPIVYFDEFEKGIVLNKTNANAIIKLYGSETDEWPGKKVVLGTAMVDFGGESTLAIRVWPPKRQAAPAKKANVNTMTRQPEAEREFAPLPDDGDDIPF